MNINITTTTNLDDITAAQLSQLVEHVRELAVELTALNETLGHYLNRLMPPSAPNFEGERPLRQRMPSNPTAEPDVDETVAGRYDDETVNIRRPR